LLGPFAKEDGLTKPNVLKYLQKTKKMRQLIKIVLGLPCDSLRSSNIAMLHFGRCGSTVLGNLLNQDPRIFWDGEIYERMIRKERLLELFLTADPIKFLRMRMVRGERHFYGFATKFLQQQQLRSGVINMSLPDYVEQLKSIGFDHFIILKRNNYLRKVVSGIVGREAKQWHQSYRVKPALTKVKLDLENIPVGKEKKSLFTWFEEFDESYRMLEELLDDQKILRLTYENDIKTDPVLSYQRVCNFLGIDHRKVSVRFNRTNPFHLPEIIINYKEVENAITGSPYEWMLSD
jgi:LPS sulfotransferase NodH